MDEEQDSAAKAVQRGLFLLRDPLHYKGSLGKTLSTNPVHIITNKDDFWRPKPLHQRGFRHGAQVLSSRDAYRVWDSDLEGQLETQSDTGEAVRHQYGQVVDVIPNPSITCW